MKYSLLAASLLAALLLAGCQLLPDRAGNATVAASECLDDVPSLAPSECLLESWVDFGLAAQRGDAEWREHTLEQLAGDATQQRLARAVILSWSDKREWEEASELFKADLSLAPSPVQPLLRQWLNGLEARRALSADLNKMERSRSRVSKERDSLAEKLDAMTAIEQSINSRQQEP